MPEIKQCPVCPVCGQERVKAGFTGRGGKAVQLWQCSNKVCPMYARPRGETKEAGQ